MPVEREVENNPNHKRCNHSRNSVMDPEFIGEQVNPGAVENQARPGNGGVADRLSMYRQMPGAKGPVAAENEIEHCAKQSACCSRRHVPEMRDLDQIGRAH